MKTHSWDTKIVKKDGNEMTQNLQIEIPVVAAVGRYTIKVVLPKNSTHPLKQSGQIIVLFNAWNKDDEVYLAEENMRNEYVLNDDGVIYAGWSRRRGPNPARWNFGQFESYILDCVLYLLENDRRIKKKPLKSLYMRSSAVWVSRILSAMINSQDDDGVLMGNWSGNYEGGNSPTFWNGSVKILQEYYKTKKPVRYGQCWVFSGVLTTALRAIGIPARSVTNYDSAHDTDNTMTIDKFIDEEGESVEGLNGDSIWNFHVWNDIWTKRDDLPGNKYDGWQAVDATPQEESSQRYQMGPAPLTAVKDGEVYAGFDAGFVFSEVNADIVTWVVKKYRYNEYTIQKTAKQLKNRVGNYLSTKMVGGWQREDVTHLYKYGEGTREERKAFETAFSFGQGAKDWAGHLNVEEEGEDLVLELSTKEEDLRVGKPITCVMNVKNKSKESVTVNLTGVISSIRYTGDVWSLVKKEKFENVEIGGGSTVVKEIKLEPDEYISNLTDLNCLKFISIAKVLENKKFYVDETKFQLFNQDSIQIKFNKSPLQVGEETEVEVSFTNPLPIRLSYIKISIEGAGLAYLDTKTYSKSLDYDNTQTAKFKFTPRKPGKRTLLVDVDTTQVKDFKAAADVEVLPLKDSGE
ncbi:-glutamine gamma-glutamyltransferase 4 [Paramuricea clavata]|uniref:protein-glutamine gamma-glutamyltransferase n=1 Tax=Paramuricea clavata TaxID=317549 RepID=A0A7D9IIK0_PARCT|nr:-glutamine gamma-glutamyltransferase 4 [Paramuricea clavata]